MGRIFLCRVPAPLKLEPEPSGLLSDGACLCRIQPDEASRRGGAEPRLVHVIDYRIAGHKTLYRLVTSLLDEQARQAPELAARYHER